MGLALVTGPDIEPVTLAEAKAHLRVDIDDDDTLIQAYVSAARDQIELMTERALFTQTYRMTLDGFWGGRCLVLPHPPVQSVTSIKYDDADDVEQTLSSSAYVVDTDSEPGSVYLAENQSWPTTRGKPRAVRVTYVAGWSTVAAVPERAKQAIKMLVGHWYESRETVVVGMTANELPMAVRSLVAGLRVPWAA